MKKMVYVMAGLLLSSSSFAAEVLSAALDDSKENIVVEVKYGGGCSKHTFELELQGCAESYPVQCRAKLIHKMDKPDFCEAIIGETLSFNIAEYGLNTSYYDSGSMTITGDKDETGEASKATLRLPKFNEASVDQTVSSKMISCVTHTGSILKINDSKKSVSITPISGDIQTYSIVDSDYVSIETYPSIAQMTRTLNDGRKIVTEFRGESDKGRGYYIRLNGESSPEFECNY